MDLSIDKIQTITQTINNANDLVSFTTAVNDQLRIINEGRYVTDIKYTVSPVFGTGIYHLMAFIHYT